jgi:hypothetical protein
MADPKIMIRGKAYPYPSSTKLGDPAVIELVTGLKHSEWRKRWVGAVVSALEATEKGEDIEDQDVDSDSMVTLGIVAVAVARGNPTWSRDQVFQFVKDINFDEVTIEGGDAGPPDQESPSEEKQKSGPEPASESSSDLDSDSKKSEIPPISGPSTSDTSREEQSVPTT